MEIDPTYVLVFILAIVVAVNYAVVRSVRMLKEPEKIIEEVDEINNESFSRVCREIISWGETVSLRHEKYFLYHGVIGGPPILCSVWNSEEEKTRVAVYMAGEKTNIDFVTKYGDHLGITTASTKDAMTLPHIPGIYIQAFTGLGIQNQYQKHLDARKLIETNLEVSPQFSDEDALTEISTAIQRQGNYIMGLPFWFARGVYWYFFRRNLEVNKPIVLKNA